MAITYDEILRAVGRQLGYPRDPQFWSDQKRQDVDDLIAAGLRQFYYPPILEGESERHAWSFLKDRATLSATAGTSSYNLDEKVVAVLDRIKGDSSSGTAVPPLSRVSEDSLLAMQARSAVSGVPRYFAVRHKALDARTGQRLELLLYPSPDAAYTFTYQYIFDPGVLSESDQYPAGGHLHAETILESCLASAERTMNDEVGLHDTRFKECLAASILVDKGL